MDVKTIRIIHQRAHPEKQIERIFLYNKKFIVEAYPKKEKKDERIYCAYFEFDPNSKSFIPYTPMNVSIAETDKFFEAATKPLYVIDEKFEKKDSNISQTAS